MTALRKITLAPQTAPELDAPALVSCAAAAGYARVGLRLIPGAPQADHPMARGQPMLRETRARLLGEGVEAFEVEAVRLDGVTVVEDCRAAFEAAVFLGARHVVTIVDDPEPGRRTEHFRRLCDLAGEHGLGVSLEPIPYYQVRSIAEARGLIADSGAANAGVVPDPLHFFRAGERLEAVSRLPPEQLRLAQICDARAGQVSEAEMRRQSREERLYPGEGELDLAGFLRALPADLPLSVEVPKLALAGSVSPVEHARAALEATRRLLAAL